MKRKSVLRVVLSNIFGFLVFLVILWIANILTGYIGNRVFNDIVMFINENIFLIIVIWLVSFIGDLFGAIIFPFNLPAPLFNSLASIFIVMLFLKIFTAVDDSMGLAVFKPLLALSSLIYLLVFLFVLISGYIKIFYNLAKSKIEKEEQEEKEKKEDKEKKEVGWDEIGNEFRIALYDFFKMLQRAFSKKEKKK